MPKLAVLNEAEEEIPEGANSAEVRLLTETLLLLWWLSLPVDVVGSQHLPTNGVHWRGRATQNRGNHDCDTQGEMIDLSPIWRFDEVCASTQAAHGSSDNPTGLTARQSHQSHFSGRGGHCRHDRHRHCE